jgi:hypothetical protein
VREGLTHCFFTPPMIINACRTKQKEIKPKRHKKKRKKIIIVFAREKSVIKDTRSGDR